MSSDPFRDYVEPATKPVDPPRAVLSEIELATSAHTIRTWLMRTHNSLEDVLSAGYMANLKDVRLKAEDEIRVVASYGADRAEHAVLVVDSVDKATGIPSVALMHRYRRAR